MKILILGADGQLGTDLVKTQSGHSLVCHRFADADITDESALESYLSRQLPLDGIINTIAYNRTEDAEKEFELACRVNVWGPRTLARWCRSQGVRLIHLSTDFVFDGRKGSAYVESDAPNPQSVYALTKYGGERFVLAASEKNVVVRTASLYGVAGSLGKGGNFVESILKKARAGEPLKVINDLVMSPTYAKDLARALWRLMEKKDTGGLFHLVNGGAATWYDWAAEILSQSKLSTSLTAVSWRDYPSQISRPLYSVLTSERWPALGESLLRSWREALRDYLVENGTVRP